MLRHRGRRWFLRRRDPRTWRRTAKRLGPPLFALKGAGTPRKGGFGWGSDGTYQVSVGQSGPHGEVTVETGSRPFSFESDRMLLFTWLHEAADLDSDPTFPFELRADRWVSTVTFAGAPYTFRFVGNEDVWVAEGVVAERLVQLRGRGATDALELEAVTRRAVKADA